MSYFPASNNRPRAFLDTNNQVNQLSFGDVAQLMDYVGGTNLIYLGKAIPGSATSDDVWQIRKLAYDGSNNVTSVKWPTNPSGSASNDYTFEWDDRASYTYI